MIESSISKSSSHQTVESTPESKTATPASRRWRSPFVRKKVIRLAREIPTSSSHPNISLERSGLGNTHWLRLWSIILCLLLGAGFVSTKWLLYRLPPTNCEELLPIATDSERLYCWQQAVESGSLEDLAAAMNFLNTWHKNHPLYGEGQRLLRQWSESVLNLAQNELKAGNLAEAVALIDLIPVRSPLYPEAQVQVTTWQQDWQNAATVAQEIENAIANQEWQVAQTAADRLNQSSLQYWRNERFNALTTLLQNEQAAASTLSEAETLAARGNPNDLAQALDLVQAIPADTHVKTLAQAKQAQWSRTLLEIAAQRLEQEDYQGAIATAQVVPHNDTYYPEAQDWIALSRASATAQTEDIGALLDALEVVQQIQPQSPLFPQAKMRAELWQSQIQG